MKKNVLLFLFLSFFSPGTLFSQQWILMGEDSIDQTGAIVTSIFALHDTVFASGDFQYYGPTYNPMRRIGFYVDGDWHLMDLGIDDAQGAHSMIEYKGYLYIGGTLISVITGNPWPNEFVPNTVNSSRWNFTTQKFEAIPSATNKTSGGIIEDFCLYHDTLIIAGNGGVLESDGSTVFSRAVVAYDGNDFINIGSLPDGAMAIETFNDEIYAGGIWPGTLVKYIGGTGVNNYNAWQTVLYIDGSPINDMVVDTFNNFLYVGGGFNVIMDLKNKRDTGQGVVQYDGFSWEAVGTKDFSYGSYAVGLYRNELFVSLTDSVIQGVPVNGFARWDETNSTWDAQSSTLDYLGNGGVGTVNDILEVNDTLWVAGAFTSINGIRSGPIARWYEPAVPCAYIKPRVQVIADTFKINNFQPTIEVQFYNNNAYADSWSWDFDDAGATANTKDASHVFDTPGTYNVSVTVNHGSCTKTATRAITIINNTGLEDYSKESLQFKVFPNPTSGSIAVECTLPADKTGELRTHNANGSWKNFIKLQGGFNHVDIPANGLHTGLNLLSLFVDGEFVLSEKVVKE